MCSTPTWTTRNSSFQKSDSRMCMEGLWKPTRLIVFRFEFQMPSHVSLHLLLRDSQTVFASACQRTQSTGFSVIESVHSSWYKLFRSPKNGRGSPSRQPDHTSRTPVSDLLRTSNLSCMCHILLSSILSPSFNREI